MPAYSAYAGGESAKDIAIDRVNNATVGINGDFLTQAAKDAALKAAKESANNSEGHEAAVSVAYTIGAVTPKITYAHGWDQKVGGTKVKNSGYDQVIIGADYALSKRTTALVSAGWMNAANGDVDANGNLKDEDLYSVGVGLRHKF